MTRLGNFIKRRFPVNQDTPFGCFADGCAWRAFYLYFPFKTNWWPLKHQVCTSDDRWIMWKWCHLGIDPTTQSRGPNVFGSLFGKSFRWYLPYISWPMLRKTERRYKLLAPVYRLQQRFWSRLDGRRSYYEKHSHPQPTMFTYGSTRVASRTDDLMAGLILLAVVLIWLWF